MEVTYRKHQTKSENKDVPLIYTPPTDVPDPEKRGFTLDSQSWHDRLRKLMNWRRQARIAQSDNRTEMAIDEDFYDGIQLEPEDLQILSERGQPIEVLNITKNIVNWILGTEVKARIDYRILPRSKVSAESAKAKTKLFKYVGDVSKIEFHRSKAFQDSIKAGLGWIEVGVRQNGDEPIFVRRESWRNMWFDHLGVEPNCSDWRYCIREKWVDLDILQSMFPEREGSLKVAAEAVNSLYPYLPEDTVITDTASEFDLESEMDALWGGVLEGARPRLKAVECWYRMPARVQLLRMIDKDTPYGALDGMIYRPEQEDHRYLVNGGYFSTFDATLLTVRLAMWAANIYLQDILSPFNHNRFPFIPIFCYRRSRDNMPYGVIRDIRDPQRDLNKRRSKSLFLLTANQVIAEKNVVDDKVEAINEFNRPDGWVEVNAGVLASGKIQPQRDRNLQLAEANLRMGKDDIDFIHSIMGVQYEMSGKTQKDLSGKAISALQTQGQTSQGVPFDNYYYAFEVTGEIINSNIEQFYDREKEILITGNVKKDEFLKINQYLESENRIANNITQAKARFIVGKQDFRESVRLAALEMLLTMVTELASTAPEVAINILDLIIDMMDDLPNKDEIVARIRKINRQSAPEDEMKPEEKEELRQVQEKALQEQEAIKQIQIQMAQVKLSVEQGKAITEQAKAMKDRVEMQMKKLDGYLKALQVVSNLNQSPELARAADILIRESQDVGENGGNGSPRRKLVARNQIGQPMQ